jgi:hypothetical protein
MAKSDYEWTLAELERKVAELRHDLRGLERKTTEAAAENEVLTATVRALLTMLTEAAILEPQAISRRVDEAIADARSSSAPASLQPTRGAPPYRDAVPPIVAAQPTPPLVVCAVCSRPVPLDKTDVVAHGTGYRCLPCSTHTEVAQHIERAVERAQLHAPRTGSPAAVAAAAMLRDSDD